MKTSTLLILGAAGAGAYFLLRRKDGLSDSDKSSLATQATIQATGRRSGNLYSMFPSTGGMQSAPTAGGGVTARDAASGLAAAGAGAGCAAIPGIGAVASPLCGALGAQAGAKAYDYGVKAYDTIKGWF